MAKVMLSDSNFPKQFGRVFCHGLMANVMLSGSRFTQTVWISVLSWSNGSSNDVGRQIFPNSLDECVAMVFGKLLLSDSRCYPITIGYLR